MTTLKKTSWLAPAGGLLLAAVLSLPAVGQTQPQYVPQNGPENGQNDAPDPQQGQPQSIDRSQQPDRYSEQRESNRQDAPQNAQPARPGAINYVEGKAAIGGQTLNTNAVGTAVLEKGQILTT